MSRIGSHRIIKIAFLLLITHALTIISTVIISANSETYIIHNVDFTWESLFDTRKSAISTLPAYAEFPENATTWADFSEKGIEELLTFDVSWLNIGGNKRSFRPYVKGADGWGGSDWTRGSTELMATMDVIWPLYRYLELHPNSTRSDELDEFIQSLPLYYSPVYKQATNGPGETEHDSWYFMENSVLKWGHLYYISKESVLNESYYGSLTSALEMAQNFNYLFPQFVSVITKLATRNDNINYCTVGLMAYSLIDAYEMTKNFNYLEEAEKSLLAMRSVIPPFNLMYEPQEVAAGVAAAARMIQYADLINSTTNFQQLATELFYAGAEILYYDDGKIDWNFGFNPQPCPWLPANWLDGMHSPYANPKELGLGGIDAPAAKENIETILFWVDYIKHLYDSPTFKVIESLKIMNLNRIKHFYFFSPCVPDEYERFYGPITAQYIPYEDISYYQSRGTYDPDPLKAGYNGKEIYGAGETLWLYLMFEALGEAMDQNAMILNLNVLDRDYPIDSTDRQYIVFNPYNQQRTLIYRIKNYSNSYSLYYNGSNFLGNFNIDDTFNITLPALGSAKITMEPYELQDTTTTTESTTNPIPTPQNDEFIIILFIGVSVNALGMVLFLELRPKK